VRVSRDTLLLLAKLGDKNAERTAVWLISHMDATVHTHPQGHFGGGYIGLAAGNWEPMEVDNRAVSHQEWKGVGQNGPGQE